MKMKVKVKYSYNASPDFEFQATPSNAESPIYSLTSGTDFIPPNGSIITVSVPSASVSDVRYFDPALNNNIYYLLTNSTNPDRNDFLTSGTIIPVLLVGDDWTGDFVLSNPDGYKNIFIAVDGTNTISDPETMTFDIIEGEIKVIDFTSNVKSGLYSLNYEVTNANASIFLEYNNQIVARSGVLAALSTGTLYFPKTSNTEENIRIIVKQTDNDNTIELVNNGIDLTSFYIDLTDGDVSNVCSQVADQERFHNGTGALPVPGDIIYGDSSGTVPYNGNNSLHVVSTIVMVVPSGTSTYLRIDTTGRIQEQGSCVCSEVSVPVITQGDITLKQNQQFDIVFEATNNPISWDLDSTCLKYVLYGNDRGAVFTYDDCDSNSHTVAVGIQGTQNICALVDPVLVSGTGSFTQTEKCTDGILPEGLSFFNGRLTGTVGKSVRLSADFIATNCFGSSAPTTLNIIVEPLFNLKPVAVDVNGFQKTGTDACAVASPEYTVLYHTGRSDIPVLNDQISTDSYGFNVFVGGDMWYNVGGSLYSIQVDSLGVVIDTFTC